MDPSLNAFYHTSSDEMAIMAGIGIVLGFHPCHCFTDAFKCYMATLEFMKLLTISHWLKQKTIHLVKAENHSSLLAPDVHPC